MKSNEKRNSDVGMALKEVEERAGVAARGEKSLVPQAFKPIRNHFRSYDVKCGSRISSSEVEHLLGEGNDRVRNITACGEPLHRGEQLI